MLRKLVEEWAATGNSQDDVGYEFANLSERPEQPRWSGLVVSISNDSGTRGRCCRRPSRIWGSARLGRRVVAEHPSFERLDALAFENRTAGDAWIDGARPVLLPRERDTIRVVHVDGLATEPDEPRC